MVRRAISLSNRVLLHGRVAARVVKRANLFESSVHLVHGQRRYDARSMMDVLVFGTEILERKFSTFDVVAVGADEVAAADALVVLFEERFGESE